VLAHDDHRAGTPEATPPLSDAEAGVITNFTPFLEPLPIPPNAVPVGTTNGALLYEIPMTAITNHSFHPEMPPVEVWGYAGTYPGPTIQATNDHPIYVRWIDQLPLTYPAWLPADTANHGVTNQDVRNVVHLHGGASRPEYDGHPTNTFRPGISRLYLYENIDFTGDGETLWYHDHAVGVTANNVYAGLAGFYLLRHPGLEQSLKLPQAPYEIPLVFQDRDIQTNATSANLYFPSDRAWNWLPVVNGKVAPYLEVEPRTYRFRMLNGCVFRTIGLALVDGTNNFSMHQIGTDDGFLTNTVHIPDDVGTLRLMPGERADVLIDFGAAAQAGRTNLVLKNKFSADSAANPPFAPVNVVGAQFMQFRVRGTPPAGGSPPIPETLIAERESAASLALRASVTRTITLDLRNELQNQTPGQSPPSPGPAFDADPHVFAL
ncbi:MAG: multicopper oxidase domain-containing protein, partial [Verrucomicrobiae bacterium]|nr:multicopper oxidase domain-containing protein [Verrucomicrobiae bacterium]